jgi:hypothetical protein
VTAALGLGAKEAAAIFRWLSHLGGVTASVFPSVGFLYFL